MALPPLDVPHHFQETEHTCGPAAVKMVFESLWGVTLDEGELADWLATNDDIGTRQRAIQGLVTRFGLAARSFHTDTTLDDLRNLIMQGHIIMVLYHLEEESTDHYAVVKSVDDEAVVLNDPWLGPEVRIPHAEFESRWETRDSVPGRRDRWALAVRNRALPLGSLEETDAAGAA